MYDLPSDIIISVRFTGLSPLGKYAYLQGILYEAFPQLASVQVTSVAIASTIPLLKNYK
jgi:hypothetical protein